MPHFPMVAMTASALVGITSEPSRAHAVDLVMLGQQLAGKLVRDGVCALASDFALVWRDHVVPVAAASRTDWQAGGARSAKQLLLLRALCKRDTSTDAVHAQFFHQRPTMAIRLAVHIQPAANPPFD